MKIRLICIAFIVCFSIISLYADDLQETLGKLSGTAGKSYVDPFAQAVATDFNGGWFHKVPQAKLFGWDFEIGAVVMGSLFNSDEKTFSTDNAKFRFTREQAEQITAAYASQPWYDTMVDQFVQTDFSVGINGPTIIGEKYDEETGENAIHVNFPETPVTFTYMGQTITQTVPEYDYALSVGGLLTDLPAMPMVAPQLTIGTGAGTQFCLRYHPDVTLDPKIGEISYLGYGIQHNPAVWLPVKVPVDIAFAFFTQNLKVGELAELSGTTFGMNVAKTFGYKLLSFSPYAGFSAEQAKMKFQYDYEVETIAGTVSNRIAFDIDGKNTSRLALGLNFRLGILNINADYNLGKYASATSGLMFNFSF